MNKRCIIFFLILLLSVSNILIAAEHSYRILFIQSYAKETPRQGDLICGLKNGFSKAGVKVDITVEYLNAEFWSFASEKVIMRRFCERARERGTDLIVTSADEAFHTLLDSGDSLPRQVPVVFFGIKYPDEKQIAGLSNVCGFTANPDFEVLLEQAHRVFPFRKEMICISDNSFLGRKGIEDFEQEWNVFVKEHPDYKVTFYNAQTDTTNKIIASTCYPRNTHNKVIIAPKWSLFMAFIGRNSKAPFFSCENLALTNGAFGTYDADMYESARKAGMLASRVLKGESPAKLGMMSTPLQFMYDYKQLDYFKVAPKRVKSSGQIVNEPYIEKYRGFFLLLYGSIVLLLVFLVVRLYRSNKREARRRMRAQTRLLIQNRLVAQRDEFDNVFHSIRDGVITYDIDYNIHFTNYSLLDMLHLETDGPIRPYEGFPAGALFKIYNGGKDILRSMLKQVMEEGGNVVIPQKSFMQAVHNGNYFPVSGEVVPIRISDRVTGAALSCRNISGEEMQRRFFNMAVEESSVYPWQYDLCTQLFTFPVGFLFRWGFSESATTISRVDFDKMVYPKDLDGSQKIFDQALTGISKSTRINFRQLNAENAYEWWEYRTSVLEGLTPDTPYSILGVCQSIQRYKATEAQLTTARDEALRADKLKSAFLANMSHEIRTPLNAIVGFSDLLTDMSDFSEEEVKQFIVTINKNCGLLLALINDILDLSRIESGTMDFRFTDHNLALLMKNVYDSQRLNMPEGVELILRLPEDSKKYLTTDNVRLQQVVNNLINNAVKFTLCGAITFGYTEDEPGYVSLFVEDTGKGISKEGLAHIFERFYKVDSFTQGAGLGLSICQTIVNRLHGVISVTSEEGKGTCFTVRIPDTCE